MPTLNGDRKSLFYNRGDKPDSHNNESKTVVVELLGFLCLGCSRTVRREMAFCGAHCLDIMLDIGLGIGTDKKGFG